MPPHVPGRCKRIKNNSAGKFVLAEALHQLGPEVIGILYPLRAHVGPLNIETLRKRLTDHPARPIRLGRAHAKTSPPLRPERVGWVSCWRSPFRRCADEPFPLIERSTETEITRCCYEVRAQSCRRLSLFVSFTCRYERRATTSGCLLGVQDFDDAPISLSRGTR